MDQLVKNKLDDFFAKYKYLKCKKGELIIRADDTPLGIFYLKEGIVREYITSANTQELTLNIYRPPAIFPMSFAINNILPSHNFEAVLPATLFRAPKEDTLKFIKDEPEVLFDLVSRIYRGLDGFFNRMEHQMAGSARAKLITELVITAKRFGLQQNGVVQIGHKLTQKELANQSGLARETVGKILKGLKNQGLIDFKDRKVIITDLAKLEQGLI